MSSRAEKYAVVRKIYEEMHEQQKNDPSAFEMIQERDKKMYESEVGKVSKFMPKANLSFQEF